MMKSGMLIYNCRWCGAAIRQPVADLDVALIDAIRDSAHGVHSCDDQRAGITELVGGRYDEEKPN